MAASKLQRLDASGCDEVVDIAFLESKNPTDLVDLDKSRDHLWFGFSVRVMLFLGVDLHFGFGNGALLLPIGSDKKPCDTNAARLMAG